MAKEKATIIQQRKKYRLPIYFEAENKKEAEMFVNIIKPAIRAVENKIKDAQRKKDILRISSGKISQKEIDEIKQGFNEVLLKKQKIFKNRQERIENLKRKVYIIRYYDGINDYYKIGVSDTPQRRVEEISCLCPTLFKVKLIFQKSFSNNAYGIERKAHKLMKDKNIKREWFKFNKKDLERTIKWLNKQK